MSFQATLFFDGRDLIFSLYSDDYIHTQHTYHNNRYMTYSTILPTYYFATVPSLKKQSKNNIFSQVSITKGTISRPLTSPWMFFSVWCCISIRIIFIIRQWYNLRRSKWSTSFPIPYCFKEGKGNNENQGKAETTLQEKKASKQAKRTHLGLCLPWHLFHHFGRFDGVGDGGPNSSFCRGGNKYSIRPNTR